MANLTSTLVVRLLDKVTGPARKVAESLRGIDTGTAFGRGFDRASNNLARAMDKNNRALERMRGQVGGIVAMAGTAALALHKPLDAAMKLEDGMADIAKVSGMDPTQLKSFEKVLRKLSTKEIPLATTELAKLAAAASQSGIENSDLEEFTRLAAQSAVAWEMTGDQTGEALAKLKTALGMTIAETRSYSDAINYLSDTTASSAPDLIEFSRRVATDGKIAGFAREEVLALGAAMISSGAEADVAATSLRNAGRMLSRGESATKAQRKAFDALGLSAEEVSKRMPIEASEAMLDVLERISKADQHRQLALMSGIFGDEARALMPLLANLDETRKAIKAVADDTNYLGSVKKEFEARAGTASAKLQLFKNQMTDIALVIGQSLLPAMKQTLEAVAPVLLAVASWIEANPELVSGLIQVAGVLVGLRVGMWAARFATLTLKGAVFDTIGGLLKFVGAARAAAGANIALQTALAGGALSKAGKAKAGLVGMLEAIPILGSISVAARKHSDKIALAFAPLKARVGRIFAAISTGYAATFGRMASFAGKALAIMFKPFGMLLRLTGKAFSLLGRAIMAPFKWIGGGIAKALSFAGGHVLRFFTGMFARVGPIILQTIGKIGLLFLKLGPMIAKVFAGIVALFSNPVGWAILGVAAVAMIWSFRDKIAAAWENTVKPWFKQAWEKLKAFIASVDWGEAALQVVDKIAFGLGYAWNTVSQWWEAAWTALSSYVSSIDWSAIGRAVGHALANGLTGGLASKITGANVGAIIKGALPQGGGGNTDFLANVKGRAADAFNAGKAAAAPKPPASPKVAGKRAKGGSVSAGKLYEVNEEGIEILVPKTDGSILPHAETMRLLRNPSSIREAMPSPVIDRGDGRGAGLNRGEGNGFKIVVEQNGEAPAPPPAVAPPMAPTPTRAAPSVTVPIEVHFHGITDKEEMLRSFSRKLSEEAGQIFRGLHADYGVS